jgi:hypothetical protein
LEKSTSYEAPHYAVYFQYWNGLDSEIPDYNIFIVNLLTPSSKLGESNTYVRDPVRPTTGRQVLSIKLNIE